MEQAIDSCGTSTEVGSSRMRRGRRTNFEDLDAALPTPIVSTIRGIDVEAILVERSRSGPGPEVNREEPLDRSSRGRVSQTLRFGRPHERLVQTCRAGRDGIAGRPELFSWPLFGDRALVGPMLAVETLMSVDLTERLADDGVHVTPANEEVEPSFATDAGNRLVMPRSRWRVAVGPSTGSTLREGDQGSGHARGPRGNGALLMGNVSAVDVYFL